MRRIGREKKRGLLTWYQRSSVWNGAGRELLLFGSLRRYAVCMEAWDVWHRRPRGSLAGLCDASMLLPVAGHLRSRAGAFPWSWPTNRSSVRLDGPVSMLPGCSSINTSTPTWPPFLPSRAESRRRHCTPPWLREQTTRTHPHRDSMRLSFEGFRGCFFFPLPLWRSENNPKWRRVHPALIDAGALVQSNAFRLAVSSKSPEVER